MKILMIHPHDLYSSLEPWTIRIKNIARQFINKGHKVKLVYFPLDNKNANKKFIDCGIDIISLDRRFGAFILFRNIMRMIKLAEWADIIHFQKCYHYVSLPTLISAWIKNKPVHYDWDDWEAKIFYYSNSKQFIVGEFINIFEKLIPGLVDTVSVSSAHLRKLCLRRGVSSESIFPAPVGADLQLFKPNPYFLGNIKRKYSINSYLVLYLGQLHGAQYVELFIESAHTVLENRRDITFMIVGEGYRMKQLKELAVRLDIDKYIIFTGSVAHNEVPQYIADADVCVACFEKNDITICKSPLKIVEYMSMGKPVVASNVGEVRNMLGGVGILVKPGNPHFLAEGILRLINDRTLRENLGRFAQQRVERSYNWSKTASSLLAAYQGNVTKSMA